MSAGVRLVGHRGAAARAPENTMASLRRALVDGADGLEFDVRILGDGTAILMHDETVDRTTDGEGPVSSFDRVTVKGLSVGENRIPGRSPEPVPLLEEVLDEMFGRAFLAIELKDEPPPEVFDDLADRHRANREAEMLVASFRSELLETARDRLPAAPRALILGVGVPLPTEEVVAALGLSAVFARHENVDERFVVDCRRHGLAAWAYSVNDPETARRLVAAGITGIISDDPGQIRDAVPLPE